MAIYTSKSRETEYQRSYTSLGGMDFQGISKPTERYKSVVNMYVDYEGNTPCLESVPGYRVLHKFPGKINGIFRQCTRDGNEYILVHSGGTLYRASVKDIDGDSPFTEIANVTNGSSCAFTYRDNIFLLDGSSIYLIDENANTRPFKSLSTYVPTTYIDGKPLEKRNMLTELSVERYLISSADEFYYDTKGLVYTITDVSKKSCCVSEFAGTAIGDVYIPKYTSIGGAKYEVTEIADYAFRGQKYMSGLYTSPGLRRIGKSALRDCISLATVQLATTVEAIDEFAFHSCSALQSIYLGEDMKSIGIAAFGGCNAISAINYERDLEGYNAIDGIGMLPKDASLNLLRSFTACRIRLPLMGAIDDVVYVFRDGGAVDFTFEPERSSVYVDFSHYRECAGREFEIQVINAPSVDETDFTSTCHCSPLDARQAILGCTVGEVFDGKIFLSGNKKYPGAVFFSGKDRFGNSDYTYFRETDFFFDGEGGGGVSSMLALTEELLVFRGGNSSSGSIFYHKIGSDDKYPVYYTHRGVSVLSKSYSLYDDALFLSYDGICTILQRTYGDYNRVTRCTQGIIGDLDIKSSTAFDFALFKGYIAVIIGSEMYLGDLRRTYKIGEESSYEWYKLSGVGYYDGDRKVYRYAEAYGGLDELTSRIGECAEGEVISKTEENGESVYYVETEGKRYAVRPTDERTGGTLYPATKLFATSGLLLFGTDAGALCVFNTDKRSFDGTLAPIYHTFMGHAPVCELETAYDNLDTQSLTKSTVRGSFGVTLKAMGNHMPRLSVSVDGGDFKEIPLAERHYGTNERFKVRADEREKGYIEKRIKLSSSEYLSPFGVYSMEYRYKIKGRMKN